MCDCIYLYLQSNDRNLHKEKYKFLQKAFKLLDPDLEFPSIKDFEEKISNRAIKQVQGSILKQKFFPYVLVWGKQIENSTFLCSVLQSKIDLTYCYVHCKEVDNYSLELLNDFCEESLANSKEEFKLELSAVMCNFENYNPSQDLFFKNGPDSKFIKAKSFSMLIEQISDGGLLLNNSLDRTRLDKFCTMLEKMKHYNDHGTTLAEAMHQVVSSVMDGTMSVKVNFEEIINSFLNPVALGCHHFYPKYKDEYTLLDHFPAFQNSKTQLSIFIRLMIKQEYWHEIGQYRTPTGGFKTAFDMGDALDADSFYDMAATEGQKLH